MSQKTEHIGQGNVLSQLRKTSPAFLSEQSFARYSHILLLLYCLSAALSIALAQIFVVALILFWAARSIYYANTPLQKALSDHMGRNALNRFFTPLFAWLCTCVIASVVGVDVLRSLTELGKTALFLLLPFAVFDVLCTKERKLHETLEHIRMYILFLCFGFALSSTHTIIETALGRSISPRIPGAVTESGQLALMLPIVLALLGFLLRDPRSSGTQSRRLILAPLVFVLSMCIAWPMLPGIPTHVVQGVSVILLLGLLLLTYFWVRDSKGSSGRAIFRLSSANNALLLAVLSSFLFAALILNLKRGPWVAVFFVFLLLGVLTSRRLLISSILSAALVMTLAPARERMLSLVDHFLIHGGRSSMWQLGAELVGRFPLGLGPDNAAHMRILDPSLPVLHRHMHNNLLNIAVETGWLGLAAYVWWMAVILLLGISVWRNLSTHPEIRILSLGLALSLLSWQISGLVEYNFGDGEVRMIAFFFMGVLVALAQLSRSVVSIASPPQEETP